MTETSDQKFKEISLAVLGRFKKPAVFDIYVKRSSDSYSKIFLANDPIDWDRVEQYKQKGIEFFYVTMDDYKAYCRYVEKLGEVLRNSKKDFSAEESMDLMKEMVNYSLHEILENQNLEPAVVRSASTVVDQCINGVGKDKKTIVKLIKLMSNQDYIFKHSITVSIFAVMLAKALGMEQANSLNIVGMGAFLHDIGIGQLTFDPENTEILTPEQRKEMWRHPELGKAMLDDAQGISREMKEVVLQHHEQPNGHGYPNGMREGEIYYPAKIVAIADAFTALITKRSYRDAFTIEEAIEKMSEDRGKFDKEMLKALRVMLVGDQ